MLRTVRRSAIALRALAVCAALALAACSGAAGPDASTGAASGDAVATTDAGAASAEEEPVGERAQRWLDVLAAVPATAATRELIVISDWQAALDVTGARPDPADDDAVSEALIGVLRPGGNPQVPCAVWPSCNHFLAGVGDWREAFGFALTDIDIGVEAGQAPDRLNVLAVPVEPDQVVSAMQADPDWGADLTTAEHGEHTRYEWTGEECDLQRSDPPARIQGCGGHLALADGLLLWSEVRQAGVETMLDTLDGETPSLAEVSDLRAAVDALAGAGAHGAFIRLRPFTQADSGRSLTPEIQSELARDRPSPGDHEAVGVGVADDGSDLIVLVHEDEAAAEDAVEPLREVLTEARTLQGRPVSDVVELEDVRAEGRVTIAQLQHVNGRSGFVYQAWQIGDLALLLADDL